MSGKRPSTRQRMLAFMSEGRGEAPEADVREAEPPPATFNPERPTDTRRMMEVIFLH